MTSISLPDSLSATAILQSMGMITSVLPIRMTIAGLLKLSKNIKGIKKKSGLLVSLLSNTENLISSSTSFGIFDKSNVLLSSVSINIFLHYSQVTFSNVNGYLASL